MRRLAERVLARGVGKGFWAVADQGVVSLGTFLTNILLARNLAMADYGAYALVFGVMLFLNNVHAALVTYPLSIRGAVVDPAGLRRLAGGALALAVALGVPLGTALVVAVLVVGRPWLAPWVLAALGLWHLQETFRRGLIAHLRHRGAVWGDAVGYLGQAGLVFCLSSSGHLSLEAAFGVMAVTSAGAAAIQAVQLGVRSIAFRDGRRIATDFLDLGRWRLLGSLLGVVTTQAFTWAVALAHGLAAAAALQAVASVVAVAHPVMLGVGGLVVPAVARARSEAGPTSAWRVALGYATQGAALLAPYYVLVTLRPGWALWAFYGSSSPYLPIETPLRIFVLVYVLDYVAVVLGSLLNGLGDSRAASLCQLAAALAALGLGLPLAIAWGVTGAASGAAVVAGVTVACAYRLVRARIRARSDAALAFAGARPARRAPGSIL